jgi:hypothetical protein
MKSSSTPAGHLFTPPGLRFIPPGHKKHEDESTKVGRGHRREESSRPTNSSSLTDDCVEISAHAKVVEAEAESLPIASITSDGGAPVTGYATPPPSAPASQQVGSADQRGGLSIGSAEAEGGVDLLVTEETTGKLHLALNFRSQNDEVIFSVTGDIDLAAFAFSFKVDVQSIAGAVDHGGASQKRFSLNLSFKMSAAEYGVGFLSRGVEGSPRHSAYQMAFSLVHLITKLANRKGDQVISVDFSDPAAQEILNLDGGRFGKLLLGFLYMLAHQHSESDPGGPEYFRIRVLGRTQLKRLFLAFQEPTVRQFSISLTLTFKVSVGASQTLPPPDRKDTLQGDGPYGPGKQSGNNPHPLHARGRALRETA